MKNNQMSEFIEEITTIMGEARCLLSEPMSRYTTFKIGGPARVLVSPQSVEEIQSAIRCAKQYDVPYLVVGNGSNLLVDDTGYEGMILRLGEDFAGIDIEGTTVTAQAGAMLSRIGNTAAAAGLAGFEFATGIPGTIGGAVVMNAGAYGGEVKDVITAVTVLDEMGRIVRLSNEQMEFGYRRSILSEKDYVVLEVALQLTGGDREMVQARIRELSARRREKQPLEYPSAGSTFKRPEGYFAAKLIEEAGLKGVRVGGAQVSAKHAGFVINTGNATAKDVIMLTNMVREEVQRQFGVTLELEIKKI